MWYQVKNTISHVKRKFVIKHLRLKNGQPDKDPIEGALDWKYSLGEISMLVWRSMASVGVRSSSRLARTPSTSVTSSAMNCSSSASIIACGSSATRIWTPIEPDHHDINRPTPLKLSKSQLGGGDHGATLSSFSATTRVLCLDGGAGDMNITDRKQSWQRRKQSAPRLYNCSFSKQAQGCGKPCQFSKGPRLALLYLAQNTQLNVRTVRLHKSRSLYQSMRNYDEAKDFTLSRLLHQRNFVELSCYGRKQYQEERNPFKNKRKVQPNSVWRFTLRPRYFPIRRLASDPAWKLSAPQFELGMIALFSELVLWPEKPFNKMAIFVIQCYKNRTNFAGSIKWTLITGMIFFEICSAVNNSTVAWNAARADWRVGTKGSLHYEIRTSEPFRNKINLRAKQ